MKSVLVGFGRIGNSIRHDAKIARYFKYASHAQVLKEHPAFEWQFVIDPDREACNRAEAEWGVVAWPDFESLDVEFAVLTCPPAARLDIVRKLPNLRACLIEKPLGPQGKEFLDYCASRGIAVSINFWRRAVPDYRRALADVGAVQAVHAVYGNGLYNNGSHLIDFCDMLFGKPALANRISPAMTLGALGCSGPVDDYAVDFVLVYPGFTVTAHALDYRHYREFALDIWGTKGRLEIRAESQELTMWLVKNHRGMENQKEVEQSAVWPVDTRTALYDLYTSIAEGKPLSPATMLTQDICDRIVEDA